MIEMYDPWRNRSAFGSGTGVIRHILIIMWICMTGIIKFGWRGQKFWDELD